MRFRAWHFLASVTLLALSFAAPAAALEDYDQVRFISQFQSNFAEKPHVPRSWIDIGVALPVGTFEERNWDPGLLVRWSQEVWNQGPIGLVGSLGMAFNDESRFNEAQVDASADAGFDSFVPVLSHRHTLVPFAIELQFQPTSSGAISPFIAGGPSVQYTHESRVRQDWYQIFPDPDTEVLAVPIPAPGFPVLQADQALTKTHFHPGFQARAGIRARVGSGRYPLNMRITGSGNVWYEHSRPITVVGAALSFGR